MATDGFAIPNEADAAFARQSVIMDTDVDAIVAGFAGTCVVSGCAVTAQGVPDMTLAVAAGVVAVAGVEATVASGNVTITAADATNPRIDIVVASNAGVKSVTAGTAAASPVAPAIPANSVILAMVYVPANDTAIGSTQIVDKRVLRSMLFGSGTVSAPAVAFSADTDTGMYLAADGEIRFATAGVARLIVTSRLRITGDGTVSLPAYSFSTDTDNGIYRIGADNWGLVCGGTKIVDLSTTGLAVSSGVLYVPDGSASAPPYSFGADPNTGIWRPANEQIGFATNGTSRYTMDGTRFAPVADGGYDLGGSSNRWATVYATTGTINTSDESLKEDVADLPLGLDFILALRPIEFRFADGLRKHYGLGAEHTKQVLDNLGVDFGGYIDPRVEAEQRVNPYAEAAPEGKDAKDWEASRAAFDEQTAAMMAAPLGLRYIEFIAPLIKAVQELAEENASLRTRVEALEAG